MLPAWALSLLASLSLLAALWWVSRRLSFYFLSLAYLLLPRAEAAQALYAVFILPGTLMHELSHWLAAKMVGVRTGKINLLPQVKRDKSLRLGAVDVRGGSLWQHTLIGLAPLLVGSLLTIVLALRLVDMGQLRLAAQSGSWPRLWAVIQTSLATPDLLIWLYLLFTISDAMFLSASDRAPARRMLAYLGLFVAVLYLLGALPRAGELLAESLPALLGVYAYGLGVALFVHLALLILFWSLFTLLRLVLRPARA